VLRCNEREKGNATKRKKKTRKDRKKEKRQKAQFLYERGGGIPAFGGPTRQGDFEFGTPLDFHTDYVP